MLLNVVFFEIMLFISYVFYRYLAGKYNLRMKSKNLDKHIIDIIDLLLYGFIVYLFNFFKNNGTYFDSEYVIIYFISLVLFGFILEIPGVATPLPELRSWNYTKLIVITIILIITNYFGREIFILNKRNISLLTYLIITIIIACILSYNKNKFKTFHPHHWQIFWFISLIIIPVSYPTKILSAIYLSFFSHGIISYSAASIIKND